MTFCLSCALYPQRTAGGHHGNRLLEGNCNHVWRPEQVLRFFEGLQVVDPGVVPIDEWRPDPGTVNPPEVPALGGVGKKP
jgi:S-adenosyl methyltransferase